MTPRPRSRAIGSGSSPVGLRPRAARPLPPWCSTTATPPQRWTSSLEASPTPCCSPSALAGPTPTSTGTVSRGTLFATRRRRCSSSPQRGWLRRGASIRCADEGDATRVGGASEHRFVDAGGVLMRWIGRRDCSRAVASGRWSCWGPMMATSSPSIARPAKHRPLLDDVIGELGESRQHKPNGSLSG